MPKVTVFGSGKMGSAIGAILRTGGGEVAHVTSDSVGDEALGDIVVLAVPYGAVSDIVARYGDRLAGKVVVDVTNPIDWSDFGFLVPADSSAAAELQALLPDSKVVKGFNTTFAQTLGDPTRGAVVLLAGDDAEAKSLVAEAVRAGGFPAVDAGGLSAARELEAFAHLQIRLAMAGRIQALAVLPA